MEFVISNTHQGQRLDIVLTGTCEHLGSRSDVQRSIKAGLVSIDGNIATRTSTKVSSGQIIRVESKSDYLPAGIIPSELKLDVVFEDDDIAIIEKPSGMVVHTGAGHITNTMANAAVTRWGPARTKTGSVRISTPADPDTCIHRSRSTSATRSPSTEISICSGESDVVFSADRPFPTAVPVVSWWNENRKVYSPSAGKL